MNTITTPTPLPPKDPTLPNPPRPKTKAAAGGTLGATALTFVLRLVFGEEFVNTIPLELLVFAGGAVATLSAYIKDDGLTGAWQRLVHGRRRR